VIANCPGCGTHYKHEPPKARLRARCGRCDTSLNLDRLRPYRIASVVAPTVEQARRAANHLPIGLDHPALATTIAENVARATARTEAPPVPVVLPVRPVEDWETEDPLPQIPEMSLSRTYESSLPEVQLDEISRGDRGVDAHDGASPETAPAPDASARTGGGEATFAISMVAGAIAGAGIGVTMGGWTIVGGALGAAAGAVAGWAWLRWTSQK
jgi:hypothetical protein